MCGIVMIRLLKPPSYYKKKYGTNYYALNKLSLMMTKMQNRGQDGAGLANVKMTSATGKGYINRSRATGGGAVEAVLKEINETIGTTTEKNPENATDPDWLYEHCDFTGEYWLGHLRYGTFGGQDISQCHPHLRESNWKAKTLLVAGNFNLTNVDDLFDLLVSIGQFPVEKSDTVTVLEKIGHFLDCANEELYHKHTSLGAKNPEISDLIARDLEIEDILRRAAVDWDGGYLMTGLIGCGHAFALRDPSGIRPGFYYTTDDIVVVASERPSIMTAFGCSSEDVREITPGHALIISPDGGHYQSLIRAACPRQSCSFERIYFSRGSDLDIYRERKELGAALVPQIMDILNNDLTNSVFSFIPNTAEACYYGMVDALNARMDEDKKAEILALGPNLTMEKLDAIMAPKVRAEKVAVKDTKLRTFINEDSSRDELVSHVYDITYGSVKPTDTLVVIDDSVVRGTTLKRSVLKNLDRLNPKRIVFVSSAPQIRYPDCYGIDMAKLGDLCAFRAAIALLHETNQSKIIDLCYKKAKEQELLPRDQIINVVKKIYKPFTAKQISSKIAEMCSPEGMKAEVSLLFQSIEGLSEAVPMHRGKWYFDGNYPTAGGNQVVNRAFINYVEGRNVRAY